MSWDFTEDAAFLALCDAYKESGEPSAMEFLAHGEGAFHFQELTQNAAGEGMDLSDSDDLQASLTATADSLLVASGSLQVAGSTGTGAGLELQAIAAAVVGGAAISGGRGTPVGTLLGVALLGTIGPALVFLDAAPEWEKAIQGLFILAAVASDALAGRKR